MPSDLKQLELDIPIEAIWDFLRDANNWAPLVPGYIQHEQLSDSQITWEFKSNLKVMKKKVHLLIEIKEWNEPDRLSFELRRTSNNQYIGEGYLESKAIDHKRTRVTGFLEVNAKGPMGALANQLFKSAIPKSAEEVEAAISSMLDELKEA